MPVYLINPNTSSATTEAMTGIARAAMPSLNIRGVTVGYGPPMITTAKALAASEGAVIASARALVEPEGVIVAAFGDPALEALQDMSCPVVGIGRASFLEAAAGGSRFGVATTTPGLVEAIAGRVLVAGLGPRFSGTRVTKGNLEALMGDPEALFQALAEAVRECARDGAERVIIGGGPLAEAARRLRAETGQDIVEPVPAAVRLMARLLSRTR